jgi:hypothetical protein
VDSVVLSQIPFRIDAPLLLKALHLEAGSDDSAGLDSMVREAEAIARPRATYKVAYIESRSDGHVVIDGVTLASRVMAVNLEHVHRVFAYVATCGLELEQWADAKQDILEHYWADAIMLQEVRVAMTYLNEHLQERFRPGTLARMNPGSLQDWPLREQGPLFSIVGDVEQAIGVRLTDSFLMIPRKSVSGIQFPTEQSYENCQLCDRQPCPGRRAPYDATLFDRKYRPT